FPRRCASTPRPRRPRSAETASVPVHAESRRAARGRVLSAVQPDAAAGVQRCGLTVMPGLAARLKNWFGWSASSGGAEPRFQVECRCGHPLSGTRRALAQTLVCPRCGCRRLIFPKTPLPAPANTRAGAPTPRKLFARVWLVPLLAAIVTAAGVALL